VYTLFRALGLRHLAVIPRASNVVGVITRHDLLGSSLESTCLEQLTLGAGEGDVLISKYQVAEVELGLLSFLPGCVVSFQKLSS
jgi:hypothetical protein